MKATIPLGLCVLEIGEGCLFLMRGALGGEKTEILQNELVKTIYKKSKFC